MMCIILRHGCGITILYECQGITLTYIWYIITIDSIINASIWDVRHVCVTNYRLNSVVSLFFLHIELINFRNIYTNYNYYYYYYHYSNLSSWNSIPNMSREIKLLFNVRTYVYLYRLPICKKYIILTMCHTTDNKRLN